MIRDFSIKKWDGNAILIYGAGYDGKIIAEELDKNNINNYFFCDSNREGEYILDKIIYNPNILKKNIYSNIILGSSKYYLDIYKTLKKYGISDDKIYIAQHILSSRVERFKSYDVKEVGAHYRYEASSITLNAYVDNGWYLPHLDVVITEICTLRCEACGSLMPLYKTPQNCDGNVIIETLDNLLRLKSYIACVNLIGGEPFVNQKLIEEILLRYKDERQIGFFQIITNGTIVPNRATLMAMKENGRIYVIFSNYGELSTKQDKAVNALTEYGIESVIIQEKDIKESDNTLWIDYGEVKHYEFPPEKHQRMFEGCMDAKSCTTLMNGNLFICPRIAHGVNIGLIPGDIPRCSFNLTNEKLKDERWEDIKEKCIQFLSNPQYPPACEYCNRDAGILVKRAKQIIN